MKTAQLQFAAGKWMVDQVPANFPTDKAQLVLVFGSGELVTSQSLFDLIQSKFPQADIVSCSTAGEILHNEVYDDSAVVTAVYFEKARLNRYLLKLTKM
jgi:hypothetical protein